MSFFAYNHVYIQIEEEVVTEFVNLYYASSGDEASFVAAVDLSYLLDKRFLVGAPSKLYCESVSHIYWAIRLIADPNKDSKAVYKYIRRFNPFLQSSNDEEISDIEKSFTTAIVNYKLQESDDESDEESGESEKKSEPTLAELEIRCKGYDPVNFGNDPDLDDAMELLWHKREIAFTENYKKLCIERGLVPTSDF